MKTKLALALATSLISGVALAAPAPGTIGVGVAHSEGTGNGDNTIFVPYTLNDGLWVEPFVSFARVENAGPSDATVFTLGAGLFKDFFQTEKTRAYFGGRLGYVHADVDPGGDDDGLLVQPVLGFGYEPVNNVMFGAEAFVAYQDSDITNQKTYNTGTNLFVRYFFGN